MKKIRLQQNFYQYSFSEDKNLKLGKNIWALIHGKEALIIDAGYPKDLESVIMDLSNKGIVITQVLPTHFHGDHIGGIGLLDHPVIYGNISAPKMVKKVFRQGYEEYLPTVQINNKDIIEFGMFRLQLFHAPGHSECSMLIRLVDVMNESRPYLFVGDLYVCLSDGTDVLPYAIRRNYEKYVGSLELIKKFKGYEYMISHGPSPVEADVFWEGVENRLRFLKNKLEADHLISDEEAVKGCSKTFYSPMMRKVN